MFSQNRKEILFSLLIIMVMIAGTVILVQNSRYFSSNEESEKLSLNVWSEEETPEKKMLVIHVAGAVKNPGVYCLESGCRVVDALKASGGEIPSADLQSVNLAAILKDGQKIIIPEIKINSVTGNVVTGENEESNLVNINNADKETLTGLPGIGPSRAEDIIRYRQENGNFASKEEIKNVSGIGTAIFEKIKDYIITY